MGARHLEAVEDAVQSALVAALEAWPRNTVPDNPSAWLYRVAHHHFASDVRRDVRHGELAAEHVRSAEHSTDAAAAVLSGDVRDDLLRMLFVCCDDAIPIESQLVLSLKTLCGFDVGEIAERLFLTEANVYKRLARARARLRQAPLLAAELTNGQLTSRLAAVHLVLYTLFAEGYLSSHVDGAIRRELCEDALRLTTVLAGLGSYRWSAVLSDLHRRARRPEVARRYRESAVESAPSDAIRQVLARRLRG